MDPFWPTLGSMIFLPEEKMVILKFHLILNRRKGNFFLKVLSADFFYLCLCLKDGVAKNNYNKHKKEILADFDPFLNLTPSKQAFLCHFYNFQVHFWSEGTLKTLLLILYGYSPYMYQKFFKK